MRYFHKKNKLVNWEYSIFHQYMYMRERQRDPQAWLNKLVLSSVKVVIFVWGKFTLVKW